MRFPVSVIASTENEAREQAVAVAQEWFEGPVRLLEDDTFYHESVERNYGGDTVRYYEATYYFTKR